MFPNIATERGHKSSIEMSVTPMNHQRSNNRKLFLEKDFKSELSKVISNINGGGRSVQQKSNNHPELHRLQSIDLASPDKIPLSKNYIPYLPRRLQASS